jgi:hypothetical protein
VPRRNRSWALWVDSDIVLTQEILKTLWDAADKVARPIMCGVYFISKQMEGSLMQPMPCIFNETEINMKLNMFIHCL